MALIQTVRYVTPDSGHNHRSWADYGPNPARRRLPPGNGPNNVDVPLNNKPSISHKMSIYISLCFSHVLIEDLSIYFRNALLLRKGHHRQFNIV